MNNRGGGARAGEIQGVMMAKVVDNVDPNEWGRVKVKLVTTHNEAETYWAWQLAPMTGKERGFYTLPEVDDTVLVAFIQGTQDNAVILGALWNGKDLPPPEAKDKLPGPAKTDTGATWSTEQFTDGSKTIEGNDRRFWKSRSGHLVVFDDTNGAETVQIWDKGHKMALVFDAVKGHIFISNTQGDIHIRSQENIFLETTSGDVKIRSGKNFELETVQSSNLKVGKDFSLDTTGKNELKSVGTTDVKATGNATFHSDTNVQMDGNAQAVVKGGATTSVSATGMAELKGSIVKIN